MFCVTQLLRYPQHSRPLNHNLESHKKNAIGKANPTMNHLIRILLQKFSLTFNGGGYNSITHHNSMVRIGNSGRSLATKELSAKKKKWSPIPESNQGHSSYKEDIITARSMGQCR